MTDTLSPERIAAEAERLDALPVEALTEEAQQETVERYMQAGARFCAPSFDLVRFHADGFAIVRVPK